VSEVLNEIRRYSRLAPGAPALRGESIHLDYAALAREIARTSILLEHRGARVVGTLIDNGPAWAVIDLAALRARIALVPLPGFFSPTQLRHALVDSGAELIVTDDPRRLDELAEDRSLGLQPPLRASVAGARLWIFKVTPARAGTLPMDCVKLTYTSGTTGAPKGVCLHQRAVESVARALLTHVGPGVAARHLNALPLATLLANIGGVYVPLLAGGCACLPSLKSVGMRGAASLDAGRLAWSLNRFSATSTILIPEMLRALCAADARLPHLRFAAVGGAPLSRQLLNDAAARNLPVFEGYGLSECASVVSLNKPSAHRPGSVGRPLPHVRLRFAADGEILVGGSLFQGYVHEHSSLPADSVWPTGDLGRLDEQGYLYLTGRKRNVFITAFGRNVAPEWIECELTAQDAVAQAAVFGEGRPWNTAVIVPATDETESDRIAAAVISANETLPDYARVTRWIRADAPFTVQNFQLTGTGRPRRDAIWRHYRARVDELYRHHTFEETV
jgi:long-chain acyl-CoA synthetase